MLSSNLTVHVRTSVLDCTGLSLDCTGLQSRLGQHFFSHGKCYIYRQRFLIGIVKTFHIYCSFQYIVVYIPPSSSNQFTPWDFPPPLQFIFYYLAFSSYQNVALGKTTKQSSTGWNGLSGRAVDGNKNTNYHKHSCTHTLHTFSPWWRVDLGKEV